MLKRKEKKRKEKNRKKNNQLQEVHTYKIFVMDTLLYQENDWLAPSYCNSLRISGQLFYRVSTCNPRTLVTKDFFV
jgi:hypothetical protein